jgi:hypothetical protein
LKFRRFSEADVLSDALAVMALFHFDIRDGSGFVQPDPVELPNVETAKSHAVIMAGQMLKDIDGMFWDDSHWTVEVRTPAGLILCTIDIDGSTAPVANQ